MSKWIVALDLQPSSHGAVRFASWIAGAGSPPDALELVGIHVIEREQLAPIFRLQSPDEVGRRAKEALEREIDEAALREFFAVQRIALGARAHEVLENEAAREHADAIVVGRQVAKDSVARIRLGTNARRLLRSLPVPVIVVPPDYAKVSFGAGPILVATDLTDDAVAACRFAAQIGARMGREVIAVHVIPAIDPVLRAYLAEGPWLELAEQEHASGVTRLRAWLEQHELAGLSQNVVQGRTIEELGKLCVELRSPLVVTGARRLPNLARAFIGSTASSLAAELPVPVAVVPPSQPAG
jgi:nucleotide-binding universal stress UspA family protein